jgi:hypothetical protein
MNKVQNVVDYYLSLTGKDETEYKKHLRAAKELLTLCDEDTEKAKATLDKINKIAPYSDWSIYFAVKKFLEL